MGSIFVGSSWYNIESIKGYWLNIASFLINVSSEVEVQLDMQEVDENLELM